MSAKIVYQCHGAKEAFRLAWELFNAQMEPGERFTQLDFSFISLVPDGVTRLPRTDDGRIATEMTISCNKEKS